MSKTNTRATAEIKKLKEELKKTKKDLKDKDKKAKDVLYKATERIQKSVATAISTSKDMERKQFKREQQKDKYKHLGLTQAKLDAMQSKYDEMKSKYDNWGAPTGIDDYDNKEKLKENVKKQANLVKRSLKIFNLN
jgi:phage tail tape-measure protein